MRCVSSHRGCTNVECFFIALLLHHITIIKEQQRRKAMMGVVHQSLLIVVLVVLLSCNIERAQGYGYYIDTMPNGRHVPCPSSYCAGVCEGFGHVNSDGTPGCSGGSHPIHALNNFGK